MASKKKWLEREFCELDKHMPLDVLERVVQSARLAENNGTWKNIRLCFWGNDYGDQAYLFGDRLETDKEQKARLEVAKQVRDMKKKNLLTQQEQERKMYEALKAKYG